MTWARQLIRKSSTYSARVGPSKSRKTFSAIHGPRMSSAPIVTAMTATATVRTVCPNVSARRPSSGPSRRRMKIGTNGADRPDATRMSRAISGIRKAAL